MTLLDIRPLPTRRHGRAPLPDQATLPLDREPAPPPVVPPVVHGDPDEPMAARAVATVRLLVEVVGGHRPLHQLLTWTTPQIHDDVARRLQALAAVRTPGPRPSPGVPRSRVASIRVHRPSPTCAEVCARIVQGQRSRAMAVRLELVEDRRVDARWTCTAVSWG